MEGNFFFHNLAISNGNVCKNYISTIAMLSLNIAEGDDGGGTGHQVDPTNGGGTGHQIDPTILPLHP